MKVAVIGYGSRGTIYADLFAETVEIAAVCDTRSECLAFAAKKYNLKNNQLYTSANAFFAKGRLADLCIIATPDKCHKEHALAALNLGYDLQLEKPIATSLVDCIEIYELAKKLGRKVFICHVLRYAPFFQQIKSELLTGAYGRISTINMTENVAYWHYAHSYVRGNWRNSNTSSPMIIAKCCHDLDILVWLIGRSCDGVSSMGFLNYFTKENAPEGSADRCVDCIVKNDCPYDAEKFYLDRMKQGITDWPTNVLATEPTVEKIDNAIKTGPYGRCVYKCDNNVVDHQVVNMNFNGGITAHLTMTAFSRWQFRNIHVHGEKGDIYGNTMDNVLTCNIYGKSEKKIDISQFDEKGFSHGGGDRRMIIDIINHYNGQLSEGITSIENSMLSHKIGFAAEQSRLSKGKLIEL